MLRSQRKRKTGTPLRAGLFFVALIGFVLGTAAGYSEVTENRHLEYGLPNLGVLTFVEELNGAFFRFLAVGIPAVLFLYALHRIAPRAFRRVCSILFFLGLALIVTGQPFFAGEGSLDMPWSAATGLLLARRFLLLLGCLVAARLFREAFPLLGKILRAGSLRYAAIILFLLAAANSAAYINQTKNFPRGQNIVLVTFDSVRPDHLGAFGYDRPTSPHFDGLSQAGITFTSAFTPCPRGPQSLATIHTGRRPIDHGLRRAWDGLAKSELTLAELLADKGYVTAGFVGLISPPGESGFEQGFGTFRETAEGGSDATVDRAVEWIGKRKKRPFFLWVHLPDATMPYDPPGEDRLFARLFGPEPPAGGFRYLPTRGCRVFGHEPLGRDESERAIALYDSEIHRVDRLLGRVLGALEKSDRIHDTIIALVGSHGESLGEHGYSFDHGAFLYDPTLHVPLVLKAPNLPARIVSSQVRTYDLLPTLLDVLHLGIPPAVAGRSLLGAVERSAGFPDLPLVAESGVSLLPGYNRRRPVGGVAGKIYAVRKEGWKLIRGTGGGPGGNELYDLLLDPAETNEKSADAPEKERELAVDLERFLAGPPATTAGPESPPPWVYGEDRSPAVTRGRSGNRR